ncbi:hypothetical protein JL101_035765 (plasmid) [Skermanella rosea]|uniref:hypothetical protein n=1 Tax=Skermanella rosea TaxID=1817965 RepID=UPI0019342191|nr:hypothetical protein [Skermanella rosea]UEM08010.1 hypothetical protein JL101_035765 [Skermanella rosea]
MAKANGNGQDTAPPPVLAVGLGRGGGGKSTMLAELVWRAKNRGRSVIVADGDMRSKTLSTLFPDAITPESEELPDIKKFLTTLLNRIAKEGRSAVLDLGGGDRALLEFGRDLRLVEFCARRGIEPVALYCLGPEPEDLSHVVTIHEGGYFKPGRILLIMNEGIIRSGQSVAGAFDRTMNTPSFERLVADGAKPILLTRLACMELARSVSGGFYAAASGDTENPLDPVEEFMCADWLDDLEKKRAQVGASAWLP